MIQFPVLSHGHILLSLMIMHNIFMEIILNSWRHKLSWWSNMFCHGIKFNRSYAPISQLLQQTEWLFTYPIKKLVYRMKGNVYI